MIGLTGDRDFLVRPIPNRTESLRSLLNRLMRQNNLSSRFLGEPKGLGNTTTVALALAASAGWNPEDVSKRGALIATPDFPEGVVLVGNSQLGKRSFVGKQRRICPQCIAVNSDTPLSWEIYINRACHLHRCLLIDRCSCCQAPLDWLAPNLECTGCGHPWSQITTQQAPRWAHTLSQWVHTSISRSIRGVSEDGKSAHSQLQVRLDKLLLMMDVLRHVLLRRWLSAKVWDQFNLHWTVELLKSPDYRFWLWHASFLHAAKDPMTLEKALVPAGRGLTVASFFDGLAINAPIPAFILDSLRQLNEHRLASKLSSLEIFDPRLHGIRPTMQITSGYQNNENSDRRKPAYIREFHEEVLEEQDAGLLISPC